MEQNVTWSIFVLLILISMSGFFSASETALMSLNKIRVRHLVDEKVKNARIVDKLIENPSRLLGSILVGNNVVNIGASALATSLAISYLGDAGVGIATGVMTIMILIFGEIFPKSLAAKNNEQISLRFSKVLNLITIILSPIVTALTYFTNHLIKFFGGEPNSQNPFITEAELKTIVDVSHEEGVLESGERTMIHNVFEFGDSQVEDVMTQRTDVVAIEKNISYAEIIKLLKKEQFSRLPVFEESIDNIIGILYIKDLFIVDPPEENFNVEHYMRKPLYTFEFKQISELFREMQKSRVSIAVVLDEYGGTAGIVTMEDLVEEIVGEIRDEYDHLEKVEKIQENEYMVSGSTELKLLNESVGLGIESEDFDTIGGFVIGELGRLPVVGETIKYRNIKFVIESVKRNRIDRLRIIA